MKPADMDSFLTLGRADGSALETAFPQRALGARDPFAGQRRIAWSGEERMSVGRVTWSGTIADTCFPHTELIIVQSGLLVLEDAAGTRRAAAGEVAVIGRGASLRIHAGTPASWIFCAASPAAPEASQPLPLPPALRVDCGVALAPSPPPAAEVLLSDEPACRSFAAYADGACRMRVGLWDSTPYTRKQVPHKVNELMYILAGSVTLTDGNGRAAVFGAGDTLFVPHGTLCSWHSAVHVRKLYCVQDFPG